MYINWICSNKLIRRANYNIYCASIWKGSSTFNYYNPLYILCQNFGQWLIFDYSHEQNHFIKIWLKYQNRKPFWNLSVPKVKRKNDYWFFKINFQIDFVGYQRKRTFWLKSLSCDSSFNQEQRFQFGVSKVLKDSLLTHYLK